MLYEARLARARQAMRGKGIDLLLLTPATDLFYLTGMRGHLFERLACCIITKDEVHFISPVFELGNLKEDTRSLLCCHGWRDGENPLCAGGWSAAAAGLHHCCGRSRAQLGAAWHAGAAAAVHLGFSRRPDARPAHGEG